MKKLFYTGLIAVTLFEILKVYFIMPMPGSQRLDSLDAAYFLHIYRWYFRIAFSLLILAGSIHAFQIRKKWIPLLAFIPVITIIYFFNFQMTAEKMFLQPEKLIFKSKTENTLSDSTLVIAVAQQGEAKAYPVKFIVYHHQVRDTIADKPVMVTYCSVCRTGRVFEPIVKGQLEDFRLVGMYHFNALFEDNVTKSWWQQSTGKAVAGPFKGEFLPEVESIQVTVKKFFSLYPFGMAMQSDEASLEQYDSLGKFERGKSEGKLTHTDTLSWKDKSWVIGIEKAGKSKAYDWNLLKEKRMLHDRIGDIPIVIILSDDGQSFAAFQRSSETEIFSIRNDTLITNGRTYDFSGRNIQTSFDQLKKVKAYQEFWHSWRTFHPDTEVFECD